MNNSEMKQWTSRESHEVLAMVLNRHGDSTKLANYWYGIFSSQLIRAWQRRPEGEDYKDTGRISPLKRLTGIIDFIKLQDHGKPNRAFPIGHHVASRLNGLFIPLPDTPSMPDSDAAMHISSILKEVGEAIEEFRRDWFEDSPQIFTKSQRRKVIKELKEAMAAIHLAITFVHYYSEDQENGK